MDESSVVRVLEALGARKIKRMGNKVQSCCPFAPWRHQEGEDKNPSFGMTVNPSGPSSFFCFACKAAGKKAISLLYAWRESTGTWRSDLHAFIRDQEGGSLRERAGRLDGYDAQRRHRLRPRTETSWSVPGYERAFTMSDYDSILKTVPSYALNRGITIEQAKKWRIGFNQDTQRLFIGISDETNKLVGFSERAIHPYQERKYLHAKDMARDKYLYGEQFIDRRCRLGFLVEGFMDVLALERHGWRNALGTMGTKPSKQHVQKLSKWFDCVIILPHNDEKPPIKEDGTQPLPPGLQMAKDYRNDLVEAGVKVGIASVFVGRKDPGEWTAEEHDAMRLKLRKYLDEYEPAEEGSEDGPPREAEGQDESNRQGF